MKHISRIPTIFAVFVLVVGVGLGVFLVSRDQTFRLGASPEVTPRDVRVSNVTDTSFSVSWVTDKAVIGTVSWGETSNTGTLAGSGEELTKVHYVNVSGLKPNHNYFFKINSGGEVFDDEGNLWAVQTVNPSTVQSKVLAGSVLTSSAAPASAVVVYINLGSETLAGITSENGNWTITSKSTVPENQTVEIFVQGADLGIATAQITLAGAKQTPPITLGKTYDFRSASGNPSLDSPQALVNLPQASESGRARSGFEVDDAEVATKNVTLQSIAQNEQIFTDRPEFFGGGPEGTKITITVHSTPVTQSITVPETGTWRWSPPTNLEAGDHTITLSWTDVNGIIQTITRQFVVLAAEDEPAFESTPSGSTIPSPTATQSPTPIATATPTATPLATASASATPKPTKTPAPTSVATDSALPSAGSPLFTFILGFGGLMLMSGGLILYKKS